MVYCYIYPAIPLVYCCLPSHPLGLLLSTLPAPWITAVYPLSPLDYCYLPSVYPPSPLVYCYLPYEPLGLLLPTLPAPWFTATYPPSPVDYCYLPSVYPPSPLVYCYLPSQPLGLLRSTLPTPWFTAVYSPSSLVYCFVVYPSSTLVYFYLPSQSWVYCYLPSQPVGFSVAVYRPSLLCMALLPQCFSLGSRKLVFVQGLPERTLLNVYLHNRMRKLCIERHGHGVCVCVCACRRFVRGCCSEQDMAEKPVPTSVRPTSTLATDGMLQGWVFVVVSFLDKIITSISNTLKAAASAHKNAADLNVPCVGSCVRIVRFAFCNYAEVCGVSCA